MCLFSSIVLYPVFQEVCERYLRHFIFRIKAQSQILKDSKLLYLKPQAKKIVFSSKIKRCNNKKKAKLTKQSKTLEKSSRIVLNSVLECSNSLEGRASLFCKSLTLFSFQTECLHHRYFLSPFSTNLLKKMRIHQP